jgi:crotonobetainyl-CoA:carnitine CoA-transferase CaiB-like acyl-CoA transferase
MSEWTRGFTARELMEKLQSVGVRAGTVNTMKDIYVDPQLAQRPQWVELEHPEIGKMHYQRPPFLLSKTPPGPSKRDPLLAEHNEYFYRQLLGLGEHEYNELVAAKVIY